MPWLFATADEVEGARLCVAQVEAQPLDKHDHATREIWRRHEQDIRIRAAGGACAPALLAFVAALNNIPLDESCGEGWHRDANHEKLRAPSSSDAHLKRHMRLKGVIKDIRAFASKHKVAGNEVLKYEFLNWKRILQPLKKHQWRKRLIKTGAAVHRIYREDSRAAEDWSDIAPRMPAARPVPTEDATARESLEREYLCAVMKPQEYYGLKKKVAGQGDDGRPMDVDETVYFQFLRAEHGKQRNTKIMHTVQSADDPAFSPVLVFHLIFAISGFIQTK